MTRASNGTVPEHLCAHVASHASDYFPKCQGHNVSVRICSHRRRQFADVFVVSIKAGSDQFRVLAKMTLPDSEFESGDVPDAIASRFISTPDPIGSEFQAMSSFANDVLQSGDQRLFAVRVLDSILEDRVLLLEMAAAKSLDRQLLAASRLAASRGGNFLMSALQRTGVCLRRLHAMPCDDSRCQRGACPGEFIAWVEATERYVAGSAHARAFYSRVCPRIVTLAKNILGDTLPVGPLHDDFAPRNVLVNAQGKVALIDMLQQWSGCVWEDVSQFTAAISVNKLQAFSQGRAFAPGKLSAMREAFLSGYYQDEKVPRAELALYEAQTVLTQWASQQHRLSQARGWRHSLKCARLAASRRWYETWIEQCLAIAETGESGAPPHRQVRALVAGGIA